MDLHNRYLHFPTLDISIENIVNHKPDNNVFFVLHRLIRLYNDEMTRERLDIRKLETHRMLLCYEYQIVFNVAKNCDDKKYVTPEDAENVCFSNIESIFPIQHLRSDSEMLILRDIIILQITLYCNVKSIKEHLRKFLYLSHIYTASQDSSIIYMKILEFVLESLYLHQFLHKTSNSEEELKDLSLDYLNIVKSWIRVKENPAWRSFISMLSMLTKTFPFEYILSPLWNYIMDEIFCLEQFLTVWSVMTDICFASHVVKPTYVQYYDIYTKDRFWILILEGLKSPLQQHRKQALYIMKNTIDLLSKVDAPKKIFDKNLKQCVPCRKFDNCSKQEFLVYEALEEKQQHLVAPALTHVTSLVKASKEHRTCNWCFELHLLQCIFEKILHHENNNIVKWGVSYICKLDENIFNYSFIETIVKVLNNSFLYECQPDEECPRIVKELPTLFEYAEKKNLLNLFFNVICSCEITWGLVAIFYVLHALRVISHKKMNTSWQTTELKSIKSLVEINLNMHSHILRTASQIELLRTIPNYVQKVDNLEVLADTLAAFHSGKSLMRETIPWNIITVWLQEVVTKEEATTFVEVTCAKYLNEYTVSKINSRTFALMLYLLHDSNLILSCKTCSAEKALNFWMHTLNKFDIRPYADIDSSINVAEFMSHLLNLSKNESSNSMTNLISLNIHITLTFLIKNMRKIVRKLAYEDYMRYTAIVSSHIAKAKLFIPKKLVNNYIEELQDESICLLKNAQHYSVQYLYGLHILYLSQNIFVSIFATKFFTEHLLNVYANAVNIDADSDENLKGKIASEYYLLLSKLVHQYLINSPIHSWISTAVLLSNLLKFLELGGIETISEVATVLTILLNNKAINATNDKETLKYILELCWRCTLDSKKNNVFWTAVENLTGVIVNDNFFLLPNAIEFINKVRDV